jgi:hypothetical protein
MVKVAVLMSGFMYNYKFNYTSIIENLISLHNADVFIFTGRRNTLKDYHKEFFINEEEERYIKEILSPIKLSFSDDDEFYIKELNELKELYKNHVSSFKSKMEDVYYLGEKGERNVDQYLRLKKAYELMHNYEKENNFKYDIIIRCRPDDMILSPINLRKIYKSTVYVLGPGKISSLYEENFVSEHFFYGDNDTMKKICTEFSSHYGSYHKTVIVNERTDATLSPESQFTQFCKEENIYMCHNSYDIGYQTYDTPIYGNEVNKISCYTLFKSDEKNKTSCEEGNKTCHEKEKNKTSCKEGNKTWHEKEKNKTSCKEGNKTWHEKEKKVKHVCIFGYNRLADGYEALARQMIDMSIEISFFPLMAYYNEGLLTKEMLMAFIDGEMDDTSLYARDMIFPHNEIDIFFFFIPTISIPHIFSALKNKYKAKVILFNWDPTYTEINNFHFQQQLENTERNVKEVDYYLTVNPLEAEHYNIEKVKYICPGYFYQFSQIKENNRYKSDVSAIITNLYTDEMWDKSKQRVNRKDILDLLYQEKNISLKIYGPEFLKEMYPKAYVSFIPYKSCCEVFHESKINLCIHAISIDGYFSERLPQIVGSKGLLVSDTRVNELTEDVDYILADNLGKVYSRIKYFLRHENERQEMIEKMYKKRHSLSWGKLVDLLCSL